MDEDVGQATSKPSAGDLLLAVLRSDLPDIEARTLMSIISWGSYRDWSPRRATLAQVALRARLNRRSVQRAVGELDARGLVKNTSPLGWVPEWSIAVETIVALPTAAPLKPERTHDTRTQGCDYESQVAGVTHDHGGAMHSHPPVTHDHEGCDTRSQGCDTQSHISGDASPGSNPGEQYRGNNTGKTPLPPADGPVDQSTDGEPPPTSDDKPRRKKPDQSIPSLPAALESLATRSDAQMWAMLWTKVKNGTKTFMLDIVPVWDCYRAAFKARRILSPDGADKIGEALAYGWKVEDLCLVPDGVKKSPFHMGENKDRKTYIDVETIFRSADKIQSHLDRLATEKWNGTYSYGSAGPPPAHLVYHEVDESLPEI